MILFSSSLSEVSGSCFREAKSGSRRSGSREDEAVLGPAGFEPLAGSGAERSCSSSAKEPYSAGSSPGRSSVCHPKHRTAREVNGIPPWTRNVPTLADTVCECKAVPKMYLWAIRDLDESDWLLVCAVACYLTFSCFLP